MQLEIGACHRRYPGRLLRAATESTPASEPLDKDGTCTYVAGLPFPPESIDPAARMRPCAGPELEKRYRGPGTPAISKIDLQPVGGIRAYRAPSSCCSRASSDLAATGY
jgi:hypothetical protein